MQDRLTGSSDAKEPKESRRALKLTAAICTWNRCESLRKTLEGFARLKVPPDTEWELLVVNNNSTDGTDDVIRAFTDRLPIRGTFESRAGQSNARNRVMKEANGDYILWTDDDVTVSADWLVAYAEAFRERPDGALFGGPIEPSFDGTPPKWLTQIYPVIAGVYAARDFGHEPVQFTAPNNIPWGANYVTRAREQARHPYNPELGYRPGRAISWEETEVILAMLAEGIKGWWVPRAAVRHHIPGARQTTKYLRNHFYNRGRYFALRRHQPYRRLLFGRPPWLLRQAAASELKYRLHRLVSSPDVWVEHLITSSESWGILRDYTPRGPNEDRPH
ncbi:MAG TPA: glycosyltransferase [Vicinamibacterales bacterium]|nr:glycosyltransferase [Vicinamibacterales bacterium]